MSQYVRFCKYCNSIDQNQEKVIRGRYSTYLNENDYKCEICGHKVCDLSVTSDDYKIIIKISTDPKFIKAMMELHDTDIIEYESRMSQFRTQLQQMDSAQQLKQTNGQIKCPYCNSTNVRKITGTERITSIVGLGLLSKKINKSFKCKNCGGTF